MDQGYALVITIVPLILVLLRLLRQGELLLRLLLVAPVVVAAMATTSTIRGFRGWELGGRWRRKRQELGFL